MQAVLRAGTGAGHCFAFILAGLRGRNQTFSPSSTTARLQASCICTTSCGCQGEKQNFAQLSTGLRAGVIEGSPPEQSNRAWADRPVVAPNAACAVYGRTPERYQAICEGLMQELERKRKGLRV